MVIFTKIIIIFQKLFSQCTYSWEFAKCATTTGYFESAEIVAIIARRGLLAASVYLFTLLYVGFTREFFVIFMVYVVSFAF